MWTVSYIREEWLQSSLWAALLLFREFEFQACRSWAKTQRHEVLRERAFVCLKCLFASGLSSSERIPELFFFTFSLLSFNMTQQQTDTRPVPDPTFNTDPLMWESTDMTHMCVCVWSRLMWGGWIGWRNGTHPDFRWTNKHMRMICLDVHEIEIRGQNYSRPLVFRWVFECSRCDGTVRDLLQNKYFTFYIYILTFVRCFYTQSVEDITLIWSVFVL